jgi:hypothetical protein
VCKVGGDYRLRYAHTDRRKNLWNGGSQSHPKQGEHMTIPPELQDRLIEVLRLAHDNALEAHQEAQGRYKGYKQHRIDALGAEAVETEAVLMEILKARNT